MLFDLLRHRLVEVLQLHTQPKVPQLDGVIREKDVRTYSKEGGGERERGGRGKERERGGGQYTAKNRRTFNVPVHYPPVVEGVHGPQQVSGVVPDHVLREALLGYAPQSALMAVLHEYVELGLGGGKGEGGRERGVRDGEGGG